MTDAIDEKSSNEQFIGSHQKAANAYGQNGSPQAASLLPGETKPETAGVAPPPVSVPTKNEQTRYLNSAPEGHGHKPTWNDPIAHGHKDSTPNPATVPGNNRPVTTK